MFFVAFFGALFYARQLSVPWLGGEGAKAVTSLLWPNFEAGWPSNGPGDLSPRDDGSYEIIPAFGLPALNTAPAPDFRPHAHGRAPRDEERTPRHPEGVPRR